MPPGRTIQALAVLALLAGPGCGYVEVDRTLDESSALKPSRPPTATDLKRLAVRLRPLHTAPNPRPGDWLARFDEPGQTFDQYLGDHPDKPHQMRAAIYVQPMGTFDPERQRVVEATARFLSIHFCKPVRLARPIPLSVPFYARRSHPRTGTQYRASYLMSAILKRRVPDDATFYIGLTTVDLYPLDSWNFVFGMASYGDRVGVWSMYRFGTPIAGHAESFRSVLLRTIKIASHESGHMLSMLHCKKYRCNMGGMNSLAELDRRPLALCPECMAKTCWATRCDPVARYRRLLRFCRQYGLEAAARAMRDRITLYHRKETSLPFDALIEVPSGTDRE